MRCNKCGKIIAFQKEMPAEGFTTCTAHWDYPSAKDGETHTFTLCEACYDEMVQGFQVPVEIEEKIEMI